MFQDLSLATKHKIYEAALTSGFKELRSLIDEVVGEERKLHESLQKYKRDGGEGALSDFEKMLVQFFLVSTDFV